MQRLLTPAVIADLSIIRVGAFAIGFPDAAGILTEFPCACASQDTLLYASHLGSTLTRRSAMG